MGLPLQIYYSRGPIGGICFLAVGGFEKSTENTQDSEQYAVFCRMGKVLIVGLKVRITRILVLVF
jgi:hypothetical protein